MPSPWMAGAALTGDERVAVAASQVKPIGPWSAPDSAMARYTSADQFKSMLRTGKRPDGTPISDVMPFKSLVYMDDGELDALYAYLKTIEPRPFGQR